MKKLMLLKYLIFTSMFIPAQAFAQLSDFVSAKTIPSEDGKTIVRYEFDSPVDASGVITEYINQTIQLYIPGAKISKVKDYQRVQREDIKSLYTYPLGKKGIRARIIYNPPIQAQSFKGKLSFEAKDNFLDVVIASNSTPVVASMPEVLPADIENEEAALSPLLFEANPPVEELNAQKIVEKEMGMDFGKDKSTNDSILEVGHEKEMATEEVATNEVVSAVEKPIKGAIQPKVEGQSGTPKSIENKEVLTESEIPVLLNAEKVSKAGQNPFYRMFLSLIIVGSLGAGMVLFAKWWRGKSTKSLGDNHIRVMTQHHLGPKKSLAIVKVAGESILIGVTDQNISMIKTLSLIDDEMTEEFETTQKFESALNNMVNDELIDSESVSMSEPRERVSIAAKNKVDTVDRVSQDEVTYGHIKNIVSSKLKQMRTL